MNARWLLGWSFAALALSACAADEGVDDPGEDSWLDGKADAVSGVNIAATHLDVDLSAKTAVATIELEKRGNVALEVGGLTITKVTDARGNRRHRIVDGTLRVSDVLGALVVEYGFAQHTNADGLLPGGSTVMWPYWCGNLYPCHSQPADGLQFSLTIDGVPSDKQAIYPESIEADSPPYMLAWAVGSYTKRELGTTPAGTTLSAYWLPNGQTKALAGTKHLVAAFDWLETHIGGYTFGTQVATVSVVWGEGMYGGMEHHPFFHVAKDAMDDEVTQVHEAVHGWYGDGVRIKCWEDFLLSEGTTSYLAARALSQVAPELETQIWSDYQDELDAAIAEGGAPAWPTGCNQIDILEDKLFTNLPYMQGAFFYKDVAAQVGADALDRVLSKFYNTHKNRAATFQQMVDMIKAETGFDATSIATARLRKRFPG